MLVNARQFKKELHDKFINTWYDEKYKYYHVGNWHREYNPPEDDWENMCFVSVDKDNNVIGCILYSIDRNINSAYNFGAINFTDDKLTFGRDLCKAIDDIFCKFNFNRIEFNVVCGNPIESSYDRMVQKFGGRIIGVRRNVAKLLDNKIYDDKIYEILREDYLQHKK